MSEATLGKFDKFYGADDSTITAEKKPLVKQALKRKFYAAYDDAEGKKLDANGQLESLRRNFTNININGIIATQDEIAQLTRAQEVLKAEYQAMFGEPMNTSRD